MLPEGLAMFRRTPPTFALITPLIALLACLAALCLHKADDAAQTNQVDPSSSAGLSSSSFYSPLGQMLEYYPAPQPAYAPSCLISDKPQPIPDPKDAAWSKDLNQTIRLVKKKYGPKIKKIAKKNGIPPKLALAVTTAESMGDPSKISEKGAQGLMQVAPETGASLGYSDLMDPDTNLEAGTRYLGQMIEEFKTTDLALCAYTLGPGKTRKLLEQGRLKPAKYALVRRANLVMSML